MCTYVWDEILDAYVYACIRTCVTQLLLLLSSCRPCLCVLACVRVQAHVCCVVACVLCGLIIPACLHVVSLVLSVSIRMCVIDTKTGTL